MLLPPAHRKQKGGPASNGRSTDGGFGQEKSPQRLIFSAKVSIWPEDPDEAGVKAEGCMGDEDDQESVSA